MGGGLRTVGPCHLRGLYAPGLSGNILRRTFPALERRTRRQSIGGLAGGAVSRCAAVFWVRPPDNPSGGRTGISPLSQIAFMSPIILELLVLGLGLCLLLFEAFAEKQSRNLIAWLGIIGLAAVFLLLQFGSVSSHSGVAGYTQDAAALFFKKFVVLTTIVILVMSLDYADTIRAYVHGTSPDAGLGEFYSIPILTCAGMIWMASATDFILIFVSLELVTVSFYTLVAFTRKNAASLEAGAKYLILGALSTGFFVYGVTWIYGVTRHTNLADIGQALSSIPAGNLHGLLFGVMLVVVGLGFKVAAAPFH